MEVAEATLNPVHHWITKCIRKPQMTKSKGIEKPKLSEIREAASALHFNMLDTEISEYSGFLEGMVSDINLVDSLEDPKLPTNYARGTLTRPNQEDNPLNAWFWKCNIKGKSSGKLSGIPINPISPNSCIDFITR